MKGTSPTPVVWIASIFPSFSFAFWKCEGFFPWRNIVAVSAGVTHTVGLKKGGALVVVGNDDSGQCDVESWDLF